MDASFNLEINDWVARVYVTNLTDERGITYEDTQDFDPLWGRYSSNVVRPRRRLASRCVNSSDKRSLLEK